MECFSRYDVRKSGRITASEFCSALSDLGHSSATEEEASAVGGHFNATSGDFILYKKVIKELVTFIPPRQDGREEDGGDGEAEEMIVSRGQRTPRSSRRPEEEEEESDVDIPSLLDHIRRQLEKAYKSPKDEIRDTFDVVAERLARGREPSVLIDKKTFSKVMSSLKVELGSAEVNGIFLKFSRRKRGNDGEYIDYMELIEELQFQHPAPSKRVSSSSRDQPADTSRSRRK